MSPILEAFYREAEKRDQLGGYHKESQQAKWGMGSCWESEGRFLYANVRMLRPAVIVEIGRWEGCSTSHLALGCQHNDFGHIYSIDINESMGWRIPTDLRKWITFIHADALKEETAKRVPTPIDLLLEDGEHFSGFTARILQQYPVREGGSIIVHDYCHPTVTHPKEDCIATLGEPTEVFLQPPADCGYACYRR